MSSRCVRPKVGPEVEGPSQPGSRDARAKVFNDAAKSLNQVRCTTRGFDLALASLEDTRAGAAALIYLCFYLGGMYATAVPEPHSFLAPKLWPFLNPVGHSVYFVSRKKDASPIGII